MIGFGFDACILSDVANHPPLILTIQGHFPAEEQARLGQAFQNLEGEEKTRLASFAATARYAIDKSLKGDAIKYVLENPEAQKATNWDNDNQSQATKQASQHALDLMKTDPARASAWVNSLPEGNTRLWAKKNLASNWNNYDPVGVQKWLNSQPANEQQAIETFLKKN